MRREIETSDLFRGAFLRCCGGKLDETLVRRDGQVQFVISGDELDEEDYRFRTGQARYLPRVLIRGNTQILALVDQREPLRGQALICGLQLLDAIFQIPAHNGEPIALTRDFIVGSLGHTTDRGRQQQRARRHAAVVSQKPVSIGGSNRTSRFLNSVP